MVASAIGFTGQDGQRGMANISTGGRASDVRTVGRLLPLLFGVLSYALIRLHSAAPARTLSTLAWLLFGLGVSAMVLLGIRGHRLSISRLSGWFLFGLAASMIASNVLLSDLFWSLPRLAIYVADALLAISVYLVYRDGKDIPLGSFCLAIGLVHLPYMVEVVIWVAHSSPEFFTRSPRIANFSHVRQFGEMAFLGAACGSSLAVLSRSWKVLSFLLTAAAVFGIVLTGCRGAMLCWMLFVALLYGCFPLQRGRIAIHALAISGGSITLVGLLHYSGMLPSPNLFARVERVMQGAAGFDSGRLDIWLGSLQEILKRPMFGLGTEAYQLSGCCDRTLAQPHNFILQFLMQFGLVGNSLLLALAWQAVRLLGGMRGLVSRASATPEARVLAMMIIACLAYGLIDGPLFHPIPLLHFALFCGLFAAALHSAPVREPGTRRQDGKPAPQGLLQ